MSKAQSTKWCPTPEQLLVLEKLYGSGIRAPNAIQIQQITAFLSPYGRIEGKNVFYWFQNHKARERKRMKKWLGSQQQLLLQQPYQQSSCSNAPQVAPTHQLPLIELPLSPPLPPLPFQIPIPYPYFLQHQVMNQETNPTMDLMCKLEAPEKGEKGDTSTIPHGYKDEQLTTCFRPLITLDLFPTTSTTLKDECAHSNSKSSACSKFSGVNQI